MIEVGQVLALKIRFNNQGSRSSVSHPYIVIEVNDDYIGVLQFDSIRGKERKALFRSNKAISCDNPKETVIDEDSFAQLDNKFTIENFAELEKFRRQVDKLSSAKLKVLMKSYEDYQSKHVIDENKIVHMTAEEIKELNR